MFLFADGFPKLSARLILCFTQSIILRVILVWSETAFERINLHGLQCEYVVGEMKTEQLFSSNSSEWIQFCYSHLGCIELCCRICHLSHMMFQVVSITSGQQSSAFSIYRSCSLSPSSRADNAPRNNPENTYSTKYRHNPSNPQQLECEWSKYMKLMCEFTQTSDMQIYGGTGSYSSLSILMLPIKPTGILVPLYAPVTRSRIYLLVLLNLVLRLCKFSFHGV